VEGKLPEIYWYVFWIGVVVTFFSFGAWAGRGEHERRHKALDILKIYAEKGVEPPPAMMDQLTPPGMPRSVAPQGSSRAALLMGFLGFLFSACVAGGLHYWLVDSQGPSWAVYATQAAMAFFGFGSFGLLLAALLTRDK
jgi:hypothetical protein